MVIRIPRHVIDANPTKFTSLRNQIQTLNDLLYNRWSSFPQSVLESIPVQLAIEFSRLTSDADTISQVQYAAAYAVNHRQPIDIETDWSL